MFSKRIVIIIITRSLMSLSTKVSCLISTHKHCETEFLSRRNGLTYGDKELSVVTLYTTTSLCCTTGSDCNAMIAFLLAVFYNIWQPICTSLLRITELLYPKVTQVITFYITIFY